MKRALILFLLSAGLAQAETPAVRRGQTVTLVAVADGIRLTAPGRALKEGQIGEPISVVNLATRRPLQGIVRDGWVEIPPDGAPRP